ncbi:hypothetical protein [Pedobacter sp. Leaf194]|uniref:hypothetical protein n=1 Tax=Pedobacter sp. Leaf194 TaxID=1736297 RepID=UPI0007029F5D|nr:hypothetical protein [Pedobacter sp. Leaf194]KQS36928.1 hypothetical protein ASG14_07815 [Pedobacter sp. Leaf194]
MKILITGGNNAKALKLLKAFPSHFILFADYGDVPGMLTENYAFSSLGILNTDSLAHILLNFCITESIDSIIPLHHFEIEPIAKSAVLFGEYGIEVLLPPFEDLNRFLDSGNESTNDFSVFVKGDCIFSSAERPDFNNSDTLNGVFKMDSIKEPKLFII